MEIAVDVEEQRQPKLTKQVAKVKVRTRPWRAIIASALAIAAAGVSWAFGHGMKSLFEPGHLADSIATTSAAIAFLPLECGLYPKLPKGSLQYFASLRAASSTFSLFGKK